MNDQEKYEMCLTLTRTMVYWAKIQKSNGNDSWKRSIAEAKKTAAMAVELKREIDSNKTATFEMVA